jgi:hypothetical protein|tara:strand:+ start:150 stop:368 length:219 start_codon:yes stop_codon:yes gene_type:complete
LCENSEDCVIILNVNSQTYPTDGGRVGAFFPICHVPFPIATDYNDIVPISSPIRGSFVQIAAWLVSTIFFSA